MSESDRIDLRDLEPMDKDAEEILEVLAARGGTVRSETADAIHAHVRRLEDRMRDYDDEPKEHTGTPEYVRQLEDAALLLWAELPHDVTVELQHECPTLMNFMAHLHHFIEHEQAMTRVNVWAP